MVRALTPSILVAALVFGAAPLAAAEWSAPERVSPEGSEGRSPAVAVGPSETAAVAWVHGSWRQRTIAVAVRDADGRWDRPVRVSRRGGLAIDPQVAVDAAGRVTVVWRQTAGRQTLRIGGRRVVRRVWVAQARRRDADGGWGPVVTLSPPRLKVGAPSLGVDDDGRAVVAWHWGTGSSPLRSGFVGQVQVATFDGAAWSRPRRVSGVGACREERRPAVAVGPAGHAVVRWQCDVRGGSTTFAVARTPGASEWSTRRELPFRTAGDQNADLGVGADGTVVAISAARGGAVRWWRGAVTMAGVSLAALPVARAAESAGGGGRAVRISVPADSGALSVWRGPDDAVRAAPVAPMLGAGTPVTLARNGSHARIAAAGARRGVAAWLEPVGPDGELGVMASIRGGDGVWSSIRRVSPLGRIGAAASPRLAGGWRGSALVAWQRTVDGRPVVERAEYRP